MVCVVCSRAKKTHNCFYCQMQLLRFTLTNNAIIESDDIAFHFLLSAVALYYVKVTSEVRRSKYIIFILG